MEIRINTFGPNSFSTRTFFSDEKGFEVASVIVMGKTDAALIDAQWTLSNAHRVIAEIAETGKQLKTIYVTHAHPDHYFGLGIIAEAFPSAEVMGDLKYNSVVWIPSISTIYGSDVLFNQAHPFTCEVTAEERLQWIRDIERLEKMNAEVIIPGHQKPGMPFDTSSYTFMKDYLVATEEVIAKTKEEGYFYYAMVQRFPEANLFISNEMNAGVFKGGKDWNWRED